MKYNDYIGIVCIIISSLIITLVPSEQPQISQIVDGSKLMPKWIPVVFAIITPLSFTAYSILTKHLSSEKVGFNINRIISSVYLIVNALILMIAIPFWYYTEFHPNLFWIGFIAAIAD